MTKIVRITDLELESLQALRAESSQEGFRFMKRLCDDWISGANRFSGSGEALFLAVAGSQVVGICGLNRDPYANDSRVGRVRRLYVLRAHRRIGVGRALLDVVITRARDHFNLLRVRTEAAGDFYTARGFRRDTSDAEASHVLELSNAA